MDAVADLVIPIGDLALSSSIDAGAEKEPLSKRQVLFTHCLSVMSMTLLYVFVLCENVFDLYFSSALLAEIEWPWNWTDPVFLLVFISLIFAVIGMGMTVLDKSCCIYMLGEDDDFEKTFRERVIRVVSGCFMLICPCRFRSDEYGEIHEVVVVKASKRRWIVFAHRLADFSDSLLMLRLTIPEADGTCQVIGPLDYVTAGLLFVGAVLLGKDYLACEGLDRTQGGLIAQAFASTLSTGVAMYLTQAPVLKLILPAVLIFMLVLAWMGVVVVLMMVPIGSVVFMFGSSCNQIKVFGALAIYSFIPICCLLFGQSLCVRKKSRNRRRIAGETFGADPEGWQRYVVNDKVYRDPVFMAAASRRNADAFRFATKELREERETVHEVVCNNGLALKYASEDLRDDRDIAHTAVRQNGQAFEFISARLQDDMELALIAVKQFGYMLKYASERLKNDREVVMAAVSKHGWALEFAGELVQDDREVVVSAMSKRHSKFSLRSASERLRADRLLVLEAVRQYGFNLQYASEKLKDDDEVVQTAMQRGVSIQFASERLQRKFSPKGGERQRRR